MNPNFGSILDQPATIEDKPKPLPIGTYLWSVKGLYKEIKAKTGTDGVEFTLQCLAPSEDIDQETLAESLKGKALGEKPFRHTIYITEDTKWRLAEFLDHCGIENGTGADDRPSLRQRLSASAGCQFMGHIIHEISKDGTSMYAKIDSTAPVT